MGKFDKDGGQTAGRSLRVWSTEQINQMMADYENGYDIDYSPFFEHDIGLKAENISFDYTDEELEEILSLIDKGTEKRDNSRTADL